MTVWDLSRLRYSIRKITGKYDVTQLPDSSTGENSISNPAGIDDYINDFYLYDFPEHLRTLKLKDYFTFTTLPNVGTYNIPQNIYQLEAPIYIDNYEFSFYDGEPNVFYGIWPEFNFINQNLFIPNGTDTTFTFTLTQTPVQQGTVVIGLQPNLDGNPSPQFETFTDQDTPGLLDQPLNMKFTNPGTLTGNLGGTGTVDYLTGVCSITYVNAPPNGANSSCHYHPYVASRPRDIMFFQQQLFLRPIPNDTYSVKLLGYFQPTVAMSSATNAGTKSQFDGTLTDVPLFNEWWQLIAYGASIKIFIEDGEHEEAAKYKQYFEEQKLLAQRKCLKQLGGKRIRTAYSQGQAGAPQFPVFPIY